MFLFTPSLSHGLLIYHFVLLPNCAGWGGDGATSYLDFQPVPFSGPCLAPTFHGTLWFQWSTLNKLCKLNSLFRNSVCLCKDLHFKFCILLNQFLLLPLLYILQFEVTGVLGFTEVGDSVLCSPCSVELNSKQGACKKCVLYYFKAEVPFFLFNLCSNQYTSPSRSFLE